MATNNLNDVIEQIIKFEFDSKTIEMPTISPFFLLVKQVYKYFIDAGSLEYK